MTDDEKKKLRFQARANGMQIMAVNSQVLSPDCLRELGIGMIEGVRDALSDTLDQRAAYDVLQAIADRVAVPLMEAAPAEPPPPPPLLVPAPAEPVAPPALPTAPSFIQRAEAAVSALSALILVGACR